MTDWASLPLDLLVLIVGLVKKFEDFAAFGTVCKSWHAVASKEHFKALWLRETTPYLMLPILDGGGNKRDVYSLAEGEIVASVRVRNLSQRKCYGSLGWFLAVEEDGSMCLLDPFSSKEIPLPHLKTFTNLKPFEHFEIVKKMVLSARPNDTSDFVVAVIFRGINAVAFWSPGVEAWHLIEIEGGAMFEDITYHAGKFYSLDEASEVNVFNFLEGCPEKGEVIARLVPNDLPNGIDIICDVLLDKNVYIVKMADCLLLVTRRFAFRTKQFQVYKFDVSSNTWNEINNLGNMALFVGSEDATIVVDALRYPGFIKGNHIYFTDDGNRNPFGRDGRETYLTCMDMGIYNLENGSIDQFYHGKRFNSILSHPTWILPFLWSLTADEMHSL